jgi:DNA transformation protein
MVYRPLRYEQIMQAAEAYDVRARRMFGGMGVYTDDKMFVFLVGEHVAIKLNNEDYAAAMKLAGAGEMRPEPESEPLKEYVKMPETVLDNPDELSAWLTRGATYVRSKSARMA